MEDNNIIASGLFSTATRWEGFTYSEESIVVPVERPKLPEYKPVGMLVQLPAGRPNYKGRNMAGGRKIPAGYIGAAMRPDKRWTSGLKGTGLDRGGVRVYFAIGAGAVTMGEGKGTAWAAVMRGLLGAKLSRREVGAD